MASDMVHTIETRCKTKCGYAALKDVETGELDNRMDSFFLAETLKYLYLVKRTKKLTFFKCFFQIFDGSNFVNQRNYEFTTEAHILPYNFTKYAKSHLLENTEIVDEQNWYFLRFCVVFFC